MTSCQFLSRRKCSDTKSRTLDAMLMLRRLGMSIGRPSCPEVARDTPHTRAREDVLHGFSLRLERFIL
eukprot:2454676-Alexandrium_andersonii.AAC.1